MNFYQTVDQKFQTEVDFYTFLKSGLADALRETFNDLFHERVVGGDIRPYAIRLERIRALGGHYNRRLQMIENRRTWWDQHQMEYEPEENTDQFYENISDYLQQEYGLPYFDIPDLEDTLTEAEALERFQIFSQTDVFQNAYRHYLTTLGPPGDDPSRTPVRLL